MVTVTDPSYFVCDITKPVSINGHGASLACFTPRCVIPILVLIIQLTDINQVVFNDFTGSFAPVGTPARVAPEPQVVPDLGPGFSNSTRYHYASPVPNVGISHSSPWI